MTKEQLLNELNKNNEFDEISPVDLAKVLNQEVFIVNKVVIVNGNTATMYSADVLNCPYILLSKEYTFDLSKIYHYEDYNGYPDVYFECDDGQYDMEIISSYDSNNNVIKFKMKPGEAIDLSDSTYIDLVFHFDMYR